MIPAEEGLRAIPFCGDCLRCDLRSPTLFYPNLMFEDELAEPNGHLPLKARSLIAELSPVMGLLSSVDEQAATGTQSDAARDVVLMLEGALPSGIPQALRHLRFVSVAAARAHEFAGFDFVPWGWSESAIRVGRTLNLLLDTPDPAVVKHVNSREFLSAFDRVRDVSDGGGAESPGGVLCRSAVDVAAALDSFARHGSTGWVIKANFSQASRNRLLGNGLKPDSSQTNWLQRRIENNEPVYVEPWCERVAECGLQFWIPPRADASQSVRFEGACEMLTDAFGRYRGSIVTGRVSTESVWWQAAISRCQAIAEQSRLLGFSGAMGMDCMLFRSPEDGSLRLRFCHDINGRLTMGRVALSLRRWLHPGETGFWCHATAESAIDWQNVSGDLDMSGVRIVPTSPSLIGPQSPNLQTAFLISADCECLVRVARKILSQDIRGPFQFH